MNEYLWWWFGAEAHAQAISYTSPSKFPSRHKPEMVEDLFGSYRAQRKV